MLRENEVEALLNGLCETAGFCLPPHAREQLCLNPPDGATELANAVLRAEGFDPATMDRQLRRSVADFVANWHERRLGALINDAFSEISSLEAAHGVALGETLLRQTGRLKEDLIAIKHGSARPQSGMVRWLTDWIPHLNDPLVKTIAAIERLA